MVPFLIAGHIQSDIRSSECIVSVRVTLSNQVDLFEPTQTLGLRKIACICIYDIDVPQALTIDPCLPRTLVKTSL